MYSPSHDPDSPPKNTTRYASILVRRGLFRAGSAAVGALIFSNILGVKMSPSAAAKLAFLGSLLVEMPFELLVKFLGKEGRPVTALGHERTLTGHIVLIAIAVYCGTRLGNPHNQDGVLALENAVGTVVGDSLLRLTMS